MKMYSYIDLEFQELSSLIKENSATRKDMYVPGEYLMPIDHDEDKYMFFIERSTDKRIIFFSFKYWAASSRRANPTFIIFPSHQNSLILGVPSPIIFIFFMVILFASIFEPIFILLLILFLFGAMYQVNYQLKEILEKLKKVYEIRSYNQ